MILQMFDEVYLKIIMLSFLIAIIKGAFDKQNKAEIESKYADRVKMNIQYANNQRLFGIFESGDAIIVSCDIQDDRTYEQPNQLEKVRREFVDKIKSLEKLVKTLQAEKVKT